MRGLRMLAICCAAILLVFAGLAAFEVLVPLSTSDAGNRAGFALASSGFAVFAVILLVVAARRPKYLKVVLILFALTYGPLVVANHVYASRIESSSLQARARKLEVTWDKRTVVEVVDDLRATGQNYYPPSSAGSFVQHETTGWPTQLTVGGRGIVPLGSIANTRLVTCNESGKYPVWPTDRYGFNNPDALWDNADFDAIIIGDSYAQGACVEQGEDVAGQMRKAHPATLNLGLGGTGPLTSVAVLREYAGGKKAKFLFWLYYEGNDLTDTALEMQHPVVRRYLEPGFSQNLAPMAAELDAAYRTFVDGRLVIPPANIQSPMRISLEKFTARTVAKNLTALVIRRSRDTVRGAPPAAPDTSQLKVALQALELEAAKLDAELVVAYLPGFIHIFTWDEEASRVHKEAVLSVVGAMGLRTVDIEPAFRDAGDLPRFWALGGVAHFSPEGYALVADELIKSMPSAPSSGTAR